MSFQSMTGFGRSEGSNDYYSFTVEIKSVNHRFRDIRLKTPSLLNTFEMSFKQIIGQTFKRGSFDVFINYKRAPTENTFNHIDEIKVQDFLRKMSDFSEKSDVSFSHNSTDFLRSEFYKDFNYEEEVEKIKDLVMETFQKALENLKETRFQEGDKMIGVIKGHQGDFQKHLDFVDGKTEDFSDQIKKRMSDKFAKDFPKDIKIDEGRFMQEVIHYLEKVDISEEVNRLKSHLLKLNEILSTGGEVGRKLEFFAQELGREVNTIGSKSFVEEISQSVIQMKIQLEKIREQALNLE
jgi:uncharacterized protein (TIGR00255 family)